MMLRSEIQSLGWVAPSRRLNDTLQRADHLATEQFHRELMLEHLVFSLTDDTDAARVLEANGVNVSRFRDYVGRYIAAVDYRWSPESSQPPLPDATLKRIFDVASAAAETSGRNEMDGALIVAAIIGEGKSNAAEMLHQHGLNVDDEDDGQPEIETPGTTAAGPGSGTGATPPMEERRPRDARPPESDLTEVHRMLSTPVEPGGSEQAGKAGEAAPGTNALAHEAPNPPVALQRTRPKVRVPQNHTQSPSAVLSAPLAQGQAQAPTGGQSVASSGNGQHPGQPSPQMPHVPPAPPAPPAGQHSAHPGIHNQAPSPAHAVPPHIQTPAPPPSRPAAPLQQPEARENGMPAVPITDVAPATPTPQETETPEETPAPAPIEGFAQIDANILTEILPPRMRLGESEIVEIRVLNSDIDLLTGQVEGRDIAHPGGKLVSRCLSLRLLSSTNGFSIEPRAPEVQWIDAQTPMAGDEATSWRWQVTGHRPGPAKLRLVAMARTVSSDGAVLETNMPEQSETVKVRRGFVAGLKRLLFVLLLLGAGGFVGLMARPVYRIVQTVLLG